MINLSIFGHVSSFDREILSARKKKLKQVSYKMKRTSDHQSAESTLKKMPLFASTQKVYKTTTLT